MREELGFQVSGGVCVYECESEFRPPQGGSPFPFYQSKGREWIQRKKEREEEREKEVPGIAPPLLPFAWAPLPL
jgi:hypothetical protein